MQQDLRHDGCAVRERFLAFCLFVGFTTLYVWAAPSLAHQHWDSLEYGYATDSRGPSAIWGNHPHDLFVATGFGDGYHVDG